MLMTLPAPFSFCNTKRKESASICATSFASRFQSLAYRIFYLRAKIRLLRRSRQLVVVVVVVLIQRLARLAVKQPGDVGDVGLDSLKASFVGEITGIDVVALASSLAASRLDCDLDAHQETMT